MTRRLRVNLLNARHGVLLHSLSRPPDRTRADHLAGLAEESAEPLRAGGDAGHGAPTGWPGHRGTVTVTVSAALPLTRRLARVPKFRSKFKPELTRSLSG